MYGAESERQEVMATYEKHRRDAASGARVSYSQVERGGRKYVLATVARGGMRWRFTRATKAETEDAVREKLAELAREGSAAVSLTVESKRDAAAARQFLAGEESLAEAARELQECRRLLGLVDADGKPTRGEVRDIMDAVKSAVKEYAEARAKLGGRATPREAAEFWAARNPDGSAVTLGEARAAFMAEVRDQGVRSYTSRLEARLEAFAEWLGGGKLKKGDERAVVSIEARDMEEFLDAHKKRCEAGAFGPRAVRFTEATRQKWRVTFKHFFSWAAAKYALAIDPSATLPKAKKKKVKSAAAKTIVFLHAGEVEKLLRAAERVAPAFVPTVAILFFAGLRPAELIGKYEGEGAAIPGLDWSKVDRDGHIVVEGATTKTGQRRTVPMESNLKAWIDAYAPEVREGPVARNPQAWQKAKVKITKEAGVAWPQDAARHSYASQHFAKYADRARLEANMGHTQGSGVLEQHYKGLVEVAEAERYWAIMPATGGAEA